MRKMGLEPTRHECHKILSLARLPVPTLPRTKSIIANEKVKVNKKIKRIFVKKIKKGIDELGEMLYYIFRELRLTKDAEVAELADAQASGACGSNIVWVQVPSSA